MAKVVPALPHADAQLTGALRAIAARAAQTAGGPALLFARPASLAAAHADPDLRAAAGVDDRGDALAATAKRLLPAVREAMRLPAEPVAVNPPLDSEAAFQIFPLSYDDRVHGALAVEASGALPSATCLQLRRLAAAAGLRLDHAQLLASRAPNAEAASAPESSEELLKLSEALFAQDIELLRNNEKLGEIEKLKNDFIEKMSRALRTPLNHVIEAIISVIANDSEQLSKDSLSSLRGALQQGSAFQRTLQNILDLWRIKQRELPVHIQAVNFAEVVDEAVFSIQETIGRKPIRIEKQLESPLPKLRTDVAKINQILFLLLDNAAKFTEHGQIAIAARLVDRDLVCRVEDTGVGICADDRRAIFDEFYQVDDRDRAGYTGAGLGLSLARDLLKLLGGEIEVASEVGKGTAVSFRLPVEIV